MERALTVDETWDLVDKITQKAVKIGAYEPSLKDTLSELTVKPWPGILLAIGVLYGFWAIFGAWFSFFTEPYMSFLFNNNILVWLQNAFPGGGTTLEESSFLYAIFVGDPEATICFEAFGVLTSGLFVSIGIVLPAVLMFYFLLGIMEDCGYLPRLAVLLDTVFHKIGLHGFSIVPMLLSLGCNIPGVVACRNMETKKERFMALPQGYDTPVGEGGCTLSGGEKQRISIARALLKGAPIVLLDEATASLDPENETNVQRAINALVANKTVVTIAHRLKTVRGADKIIVLNNAGVAEEGKHQELIYQEELYRQLWDLQQQSAGWRMRAA